MAGVEIRHSVDDLAAVGTVETLSSIKAVGRLVVDSSREILRRAPALALLVDYPGTNLRLAAILRRMNVPVLYFVAPQRWAWMPTRARPLRGLVDQLAVTLPFEQEWFSARGVPARFVGHPLVDLFKPVVAEAVRARLGLDGRPVLAVLPGSRSSELEHHLPLLSKVLAWLPDVQPVLAVATEASARRIADWAPEVPRVSSEEAFALADAALCASGTATLEAALAGVPTAVFYRLSRLSGMLAKRLIRVPYVALPNILLDEPVMPELLQESATPAALTSTVHRLLDPFERSRQQHRLRDVRLMLGEPGVAERVADLAEALLRRAKRLRNRSA